ncbi:MAG: Rpn family recombination-promoting nuclease/putative transposase [bacterium]
MKKFDLKSVTINDSSYIDENLKNHLSDLVIKLTTKQKQKTDIYILFEHKSYVPKNIIWQLLRYQYMMFEEDYRAERKFRIILPVVFYHGERKWKCET